VIIGVGVDVVTGERMERALAEYGGKFEERVFTAAERAACAGRANRTQALAARFAAKEACLKALGIGIQDGYGVHQIEIVAAEGGRPELRLDGRVAERARALGVRSTHVSLTHEAAVSVAVVVVEG
jgi:holo-[acyl-carrier protein] synthase